MTDGARLPRHLPRPQTVLLVVVAALVLLWVAPTVIAFIGEIDLGEAEHVPLIIFGFVVLDAVVPVFPSESLLTTASNLAAQPGSDLDLWRLVLAGTLGAIVGDSLLYWLSRTVLRRTMADRVEQAQSNEKVARAMQVLSGTAPLLIVFGRFVPGVRFMLGATMGLTRYPYPRFLLWDSIGGAAWATYTCVFSYLVASVIEDKPLLSIAVSVVVSTALLALLYVPIRRSWEASAPPTEEPSGAAVG